ncbi:MAG TPA: transcriptional regulator [Halomonas sp.]|jgi:ATP-dependent DNA helicase RecG|uniref:RNA-binding domain-containing protein n=1 Tax=Halomonadaceae TaxID=28256 RepID=UPI0005CC8661|nr:MULTISPECIES: RNA-binding domain-containing protein [Halomonas]KJD19191.1 transcriptional regulator [Halomonas meridiana]MCC4289615.1 putative DNA binding domain-containing protein [Halomonas axialensis]MCD1652292.1 putative DNA binding domain-containing protein [Halomonas axialensis]MCD2088420.1 putative DNA binding domain-containing protein [Halomonas meridiana]MCF2914272.1 putative DNA binding domain-containing protein [Halomonas sp. Cn5-12]|tara:strand:+ start:202 stop:1875 length:1674 start_codon:yes stop_codon:yes gene_type:complete
MDQLALKTLLNTLIGTWENEVVEFKQADENYKTDKIGEYFSALSNEANLSGQESAWLVFGVNNKTRAISGTHYREEADRLNGLKHQIAQSTEPSVTFRNIHVLEDTAGRVVLFEIPAAPRGIPIAWKGHYYSRAGESLVPLGFAKQDEIRQQTIAEDWTAQPVSSATFEDLDEAALQRARKAFAKKYANRFAAEEVEAWPLSTFLDRARVTQNGAITRTTLLLLGKPESTWKLSPHPAQMTWKLEGPERAYEHFSPPFLLSTSWLYRRIRNIQLRLLPQDELLPIEVAKYDQKIVLESLHNCIAHQDYTRNGRVIVIEQPDRLVFENEGMFFEGQPGDYLEGNRVPRKYRNPFLAQAMAELNMIDTMGFGIHDMYARQAKRYFPMPDYDLSEASAVRLTIYGGVVDPAYSRLLIQKTDLPLADILALDRVQKKLPLPDEAITRLRRAGLIEGRKPNLYVSAKVAKATSDKVDYIRTRAQDDEFYAKLLIDYLEKFGHATRSEIDKLLMDKLSDGLSPEQKRTKISNLVTKLRRRGRIHNSGSRGHPIWQLAERKSNA